MVERSLRMREARGSIPRTSIPFIVFPIITANGHDERILSFINTMAHHINGSKSIKGKYNMHTKNQASFSSSSFV